jgi:hypothetical protein
MLLQSSPPSAAATVFSTSNDHVKMDIGSNSSAQSHLDRFAAAAAAAAAAHAAQTAAAAAASAAEEKTDQVGAAIFEI